MQTPTKARFVGAVEPTDEQYPRRNRSPGPGPPPPRRVLEVLPFVWSTVFQPAHDGSFFLYPEVHTTESTTSREKAGIVGECCIARFVNGRYL
jgi:hypothetical protein